MAMRRLTALLAGVMGLFVFAAMGCESKPEEAAGSPAAGENAMAASPAAPAAEGAMAPGAPAAGADK